MAGRKRQTREPQQQRAIETRREILQAAIRLFARRGFANTTVTVLAKEIGMSPGVLYFHFPAKEDLLLAAIEQLMNEFNQQFLDLFTEEVRKLSATDQLRRFFDRAQHFLTDTPEYGIFFGMITAESAESSKRVAEAMRALFEGYAQILGSVVRYGQKKTGEFRTDVDPVQFGHMVLAAYTGVFTHQHLFRADPMAATSPVKMLDLFLFNSIRKPAASSGATSSGTTATSAPEAPASSAP